MIGEQNVEIDHSYFDATNITSEKLVSKLNSFGDFSIIAQGAELKVVKAFLHQCPYFDAMLSCEWLEKS